MRYIATPPAASEPPANTSWVTVRITTNRLLGAISQSGSGHTRRESLFHRTVPRPKHIFEIYTGSMSAGFFGFVVGYPLGETHNRTGLSRQSSTNSTATRRAGRPSTGMVPDTEILSRSLGPSAAVSETSQIFYEYLECFYTGRIVALYTGFDFDSHSCSHRPVLSPKSLVLFF